MGRTVYKPYGLVLSRYQKEALSKSIRDKEAVTLKLKLSNLKNGNDVLNLTQRQINKLNVAFNKRKGATIRISKTQMHKIVNNERRITKKDFKKTKNEKLLEYMQEKEGRGLLSSIIPLASKVASKVLPAVGLSSIMGLTEGLSKKIFGGNCGNDSELRVYVVSHDKIPKLVEKGEHLLNDRQKGTFKKHCKQERM